jgi:NADPH-dependent curcumin reductase CurA
MPSPAVLGCKVIATAGSEEKRRICIEKAGVDAAVNYGKSDWQVSELHPYRVGTLPR